MSICSIVKYVFRGLFIVVFFTQCCYLHYFQQQVANGIANNSTAVFNIDNSSVAQMFDTTAFTQEPFTQTTMEDDPTDYDYGSDEEDMVDAPVIDELDTEGMQADQPVSDYEYDNMESQLSEKYDNNSMQNPRTAGGDRKDDNTDEIEADDWEATHKKVQEVYDYFVASQNKPTTQPTNILVTEDNASDNMDDRKYSNKIEGDDWEATHKRVQEIYDYFVALQNKPTSQPNIISDTLDKAMKEYVDQEIAEANVFADAIVDNLDLVLNHTRSMEQRLTGKSDHRLMDTEMEGNGLSQKTGKEERTNKISYSTCHKKILQ